MQNEEHFDRRRFLRLGFYAAAALGLFGIGHFLDLNDEADKTDLGVKSSIKDESAYRIPRRQLGLTGEQISLIGLGGSFTLADENKAEEAEKIIERAIDAGINYLDTAPTYGHSEANLGRVMERRRKEVFLAGKTRERSYDGTLRVFEQSLERLKTDRLDLLQLHGIHTSDELETVFAPDGALEAIKKLKDEKAVRYIGITSHKNPRVLMEALERFDFDTALFPLNAADPYYQSFQKEFLPAAQAKSLGLIAMKSAAYGRIFRKGGISTMQEALGYTLSFPVSTTIIGTTTLSELEENIRLAENFKPLPAEELERLEQLVMPYQDEANFFKTEW